MTTSTPATPRGPAAAGPTSLALALALLLAASAVAQKHPLPTSDLDLAMEPDFVRRDLTVFVEVLGLDQDQTKLLETLYRDYEGAVESGTAAARAQMRTVRPEPEEAAADYRRAERETKQEMRRLLDDSRARLEQAPDAAARKKIMDEYETRVRELREALERQQPGVDDDAEFERMRQRMGEIASAWRQKQAALTGEFIAGVQAILNEDQAARWPALDRKLRRQKTLPQGELSGESVDLFLLVREQDLAPALLGMIQPELDAYELRLDQTLRARNDGLAETGGALREAVEDREVDRALAIIDGQLALRVAVRDATEEAARTIAATLPPTNGAALVEAFDLRAFPRVFRPTRTERALRMAQHLDGLEPTALEAVQELERAFLAELAAVNLRIRELIRSNEPALRRERYARIVDREHADEHWPDEDPVAEAFQVRRALEERYLGRLRGLLTEEQVARLPVAWPPPAVGGGGPGAEGGSGSGLPGQTWAIEQFDEDGDGRLGPAEMERLREFLREKRRPAPAPPE